MSYKQAFIIECRDMCSIFEARTLFLTGEARESVRVLMRRSPCTPK
jgi:hypothetical protein